MALAGSTSRSRSCSCTSRLFSGGSCLVKLAKFLAVPVVLLVSALMAVPAFAHSATISKLTATCNSDHKVCFSFDVTTSQFDQTGRDVLVDLVDRKSNQVLETLTEHLSANTTHVQDCFHATVSTST